MLGGMDIGADTVRRRKCYVYGNDRERIVAVRKQGEEMRVNHRHPTERQGHSATGLFHLAFAAKEQTFSGKDKFTLGVAPADAEGHQVA